MDAYRILLVDDDADLRATLSARLAREGHDVTTAADGGAAVTRACTESFDMVLLDVALGPGIDGNEAARALRARGNMVPIVMLTARDSEADAVLGLEAGADDYVTKPFGFAELRSRMRAVLRRSRPGEVATGAVELGPLRLDRRQRTVEVRGRPVELTFAEFELLNALITDPGRTFDRQQLLTAIWGTSTYRDPRAIDVHVRHLREKLEDEPARPRLLLTVRGVGYRLVPA